MVNSSNGCYPAPLYPGGASAHPDPPVYRFATLEYFICFKNKLKKYLPEPHTYFNKSQKHLKHVNKYVNHILKTYLNIVMNKTHVPG